MNTIYTMTQPQLSGLLAQTQAEYQRCKAKGLKLDMSRGKPGSKQLDISNDLFQLPLAQSWHVDGTDARNYGMVAGLPCARAYWADILGVKPGEVFAAGNASLQLMYDTISKAFTHGLLHSASPWCKQEGLKFLCPVPGYDRHFRITENFGMKLIAVPMTPEGPDMDQVEALIRDPKVKGMWCVPKYSNPEGVLYSDAVVRRIAAMHPAAEDFVLMWDNAYCIHEFEGDFVPFPDILSLCREAGNPDMVFEFASTSKVTFPGSGIACFAASEANVEYMVKLLSVQTIGYDKLNQLRHVQYLEDKPHTLEHMKKHAAILKPKFHEVLSQLDEKVAPLGFTTYSRPRGGYFISLNTMPGCAKRTYALAKEAGVVLTAPGAAYPYGIDPKDENLRIAPTYPPLEELKAATEVLCLCLKLAALEKLLAEN